MVSSIYDPLGFLSPLTLPAKLLLQELCRQDLGWDMTIPNSLSDQWTKWTGSLSQLTDFEVPRCFKPKDFGESVHNQIHHFSDASELGYGTVSYLRMTNAEGKFYVAFLIGKARVAPLKRQTIPRLELAAAALSVKVDKMLKKIVQCFHTYSMWRIEHLGLGRPHKSFSGDILTQRETLLTTVLEEPKMDLWTRVSLVVRRGLAE